MGAYLGRVGLNMGAPAPAQQPGRDSSAVASDWLSSGFMTFVSVVVALAVVSGLYFIARRALRRYRRRQAAARAPAAALSYRPRATPFHKGELRLAVRPDSDVAHALDAAASPALRTQTAAAAAPALIAIPITSAPPGSI